MTTIPCVGCGALVSDIDSPSHRYLGSSPGCWAIYGEVLAREFGNYRYVRKHQMTVDAYAVQHPGTPSPQTMQSLAVHLISLHLMFERGLPPAETPKIMQRATRDKGRFSWLEPPASLGELTVLHVHAAPSPEEHLERVEAWARAAWSAWAAHHPTVRAWAASSARRG